MPAHLQNQVKTALLTAGYSEIAEQYSFQLSEADRPEKAPLPLVAFWQDTMDQFASAIAVRWVGGDGRHVDAHLKAIANDLWAPYSILAGPGGCDIWETIGTGSANEQVFRQLEAEVAYEALPSALSRRTSELGPETVANRKRIWRQKALYEASPEPNAFLQWAFRPTRARLADVFSALVSAIGDLAELDELLTEHVRWLIRLLGVRIIWDKRWRDPGDRTSARDLVSAAQSYPTMVGPHEAMHTRIGLAVAERVVQQLAHIHLAAADGGLLSQLMQGNGVPKQLLQRWRLFLTPPDVAWRLVAGLPIEGITPEERFVWDGTCGSGTILVAGLERLRSLSAATGHELRAYLIDHVRGNEQQPAMADLTRIALDLALGAAAGPDWTVTVGEVSRAISSASVRRPSVIVSNPPFHRSGRSLDEAIPVIEGYLDVLRNDGLLAVLAPRSLLGTVGATGLRKRMIEECQFLEVAELPPGTFPRTEVQATALLARKHPSGPGSSNSVSWRVFDRSRSREFVQTLKQNTWRNPPRYAFRPPLALRLEAALSGSAMLSEFVPKSRRTESLKLGAARDEVTAQQRPGTVPYLSGWTGMLPFYIPWQEHPQWIPYPSPDMVRDRAQNVDLFRMKKVIVTRRASKDGNAWRIRAAVDSRGLFPSDEFEALAPQDPLSPEVLAALSNSPLINCWLRLNNPSDTLSLATLLQMPIPRRIENAKVLAIERKAEGLASLWRTIALKGRSSEAVNRALDLTYALDRDVYALYGISLALQKEIALFFRWAGDARPGFDEPAVATPQADTEDLVLTRADARRLKKLFEARDERELTAAESRELEELVEQWERANLQSDDLLVGRNASLDPR